MGATLIEYTLIGSLIATMLIVGYRTVGNGYIKIYNNIANGIDEAK
jgi:Flp pilus assembly pilin Flp